MKLKDACLFLSAFLLLVCAFPAAAQSATDVQCEGCVGSTDILDGGVKAMDIAPGAVTSGKLKNAAVNSNKLAWGAVTSNKLSDGAVGYDKLAGDVQRMLSDATGQRTMKLVDANQMLVGDVAALDVTQFPSIAALVWVDIDAGPVAILVRDTKIVTRDASELYFASTDCTGPPLVSHDPEALIDPGAVVVTADSRVWQAVPDSLSERMIGSIYYQSVAECRMVNERRPTSLASETGTFPDFTPPYSIVYE